MKFRSILKGLNLVILIVGAATFLELPFNFTDLYLTVHPDATNLDMFVLYFEQWSSVIFAIFFISKFFKARVNKPTSVESKEGKDDDILLSKDKKVVKK